MSERENEPLGLSLSRLRERAGVRASRADQNVAGDYFRYFSHFLRQLVSSKVRTLVSRAGSPTMTPGRLTSLSSLLRGFEDALRVPPRLDAFRRLIATPRRPRRYARPGACA